MHAHRRYSRAFLAVVLTLFLVGLPTGAQALYHEDKPVNVGPNNPEVEHDYPPIPVNMPAANQDEDVQDATMGPEQCKTAAYCDTIPMSFSATPGQLTSFALQISWSLDARPEGDPAGAGSTDLDIYLYKDEIQTTRDQQGNATEEHVYTIEGNAATSHQPELILLADMRPSSPTLKYWIVVLQWSGTSPYHFKAKYAEGSVPDLSEFEGIGNRPFKLPTGSAFNPKTGALALKPKADEAVAEGPGLPNVKVPGPDGELSDYGLLAVKGQATEQRRRNMTPLIVLVVALLILGGSTFAFFYVRSRRQAEEAS
jgi:hypothetical protein